MQSKLSKTLHKAKELNIIQQLAKYNIDTEIDSKKQGFRIRGFYEEGDMLLTCKNDSLIAIGYISKTIAYINSWHDLCKLNAGYLRLYQRWDMFPDWKEALIDAKLIKKVTTYKFINEFV